MKKLLLLLSIFILTSCSETAVESISETETTEEVVEDLVEESVDYSSLPYFDYISEDNPEVTITYNGEYEITVQLFPEVAPNTVNNFLELSSSGFYIDTPLHRIITDFVIQGGDPTGTGMSGADYNIQGEFLANGFSNPLSHERGVISMARSSDPNSASSQYFICHQDADFLDGSYAAFGGIIEGLDVLDILATVATDSNDTPIDALIITNVEVNMNGYTYDEVVVYDNSYYPASTYQNDTNPVVVIEYEELGSITIELFPEIAPITVENFLTLIEDDFYTGIIMHRIIEGFMIQGGDPTGTGTSGSGTNILGEFRSNNVNNPLTHERGVISMARSSANDSASSQFFIVHADANFLDGNYAAFGVMIDGFDVLDKIASVDTNSSDKPLEDIVIKSITIK